MERPGPLLSAIPMLVPVTDRHATRVARLPVVAMDVHLELEQENAFLKRLRNLMIDLYRAVTGPNHHL